MDLDLREAVTISGASILHKQTTSENQNRPITTRAAHTEAQIRPPTTSNFRREVEVFFANGSAILKALSTLYTENTKAHKSKLSLNAAMNPLLSN